MLQNVWAMLDKVIFLSGGTHASSFSSTAESVRKGIPLRSKYCFSLLLLTVQAIILLPPLRHLSTATLQGVFKKSIHIMGQTGILWMLWLYLNYGDHCTWIFCIAWIKFYWCHNYSSPAQFTVNMILVVCNSMIDTALACMARDSLVRTPSIYMSCRAC